MLEQPAHAAIGEHPAFHASCIEHRQHLRPDRRRRDRDLAHPRAREERAQRTHRRKCFGSVCQRPPQVLTNQRRREARSSVPRFDDHAGDRAQLGIDQPRTLAPVVRPEPPGPGRFSPATIQHRHCHHKYADGFLFDHRTQHEHRRPRLTRAVVPMPQRAIVRHRASLDDERDAGLAGVFAHGSCSIGRRALTMASCSLISTTTSGHIGKRKSSCAVAATTRTCGCRAAHFRSETAMV